MCITQSKEGLVVLKQRYCGRLKKRGRVRHLSSLGEIAAGRESQAIGRVERLGRRTEYSSSNRSRRSMTERAPEDPGCSRVYRRD